VELEKLIELGERLIKAGFLGGKGCVIKILFSRGQQSTDSIDTALKASNEWAGEGMRTFPDMSYPATQGVVWAFIEELAGCELELTNLDHNYRAVTSRGTDKFQEIYVMAQYRIEAIVLIAEEMKRRKDEEASKKQMNNFVRGTRVKNTAFPKGGNGLFLAMDYYNSEYAWVSFEEYRSYTSIYCQIKDLEIIPTPELP